MVAKKDSPAPVTLKCGLEIHQQLDTGKLFCRCSGESFDTASIIVRRKLRGVAGETGKVDTAAAMETGRDRTFQYEGTPATCCEIELDEEPPAPMNAAALQVVLQVAAMLKARVVDEIFVMRKTVVDGSNTSGFQRTALVAMGGVLETSEGAVRIDSICLEEEAARIIEQKSDVVRYGLDRLGTPLIEIGTAPDIKSPEHAREVAEKLGLLIRSTGKAKRGIGSIRQDVNVSIPDGKRVEIKGAQELKAIPTLITNEMARQHSLSIIAKELAKRGALGVDATGVNGEEQRDTKKDEKKAGMQGELPTLMEVTSCFAGTECKVIHASGSAWAVRLPRFVGLLGRELIPGTGGRRLGSELSDHAKVAAGVKGLFHSDELPNYGVSDSEVAAVRKALGIAAHNHKDDASCNHAADAFIIVAAPEAQAKRALAAALCRAQLAVVGNVEEVRRANADGTTSFMRWMPGSARMYPETDLGPVVPDLSAVEIPELIEEREARYVSAGVPADLARTLAKDKHELFDHYCKSTSLEPGFIAQLLLTIPKDIKKRLGLDPEKVKQKDFDAVVAALDAGSIAKEAAAEVFCAIIQGTGAADAIASYGQLAEGEVRKRVAAIAAEAGDAPPNALMGMVMKELRGKADGKLIAKIVKELTVPVADATASGAVLQHIDPADPPAPSHSVKKSKAHK